MLYRVVVEWVPGTHEKLRFHIKGHMKTFFGGSPLLHSGTRGLKLLMKPLLWGQAGCLKKFFEEFRSIFKTNSKIFLEGVAIYLAQFLMFLTEK